MDLCDVESFIFDPDAKSELEVHNGQQWKDCVSDADRSIYWVQNGNELRPQYRTTSPHHTGSIEVTFEVDQTEEDYDEDDETSEEEGGKKDDASSDEDWLPMDLEGIAKVKGDLPSDEFSDDEELNEKMQKKKQLCTDCGTFYRTENHICEHKTKHYVCNVCGKRCVTQLSLKLHSNIHSETYEHYCKYCYTSFKTKLDKLAHEKKHHNEKNPYKCRDCTATFCTHAERRKHVKQHRGENGFECEICGFTTGNKHKLRHMMIHTGVKPFKCVICERTFNQSGNLKSHMRVHTGEQPYKCKHCGKSFNHNVSLKSHVQRYHPPESGDDNLMKISDVSDADENVQQQDTETVQQETVQQETVQQETVQQETVQQETVQQETVQKETVQQETVQQETVQQETVQKETVKKTGRGVTGRPPGRPKKSLDVSEEQNSDKGKKKKTVQSKRNFKSGSDSDYDPDKDTIGYGKPKGRKKKS